MVPPNTPDLCANDHFVSDVAPCAPLSSPHPLEVNQTLLLVTDCAELAQRLTDAIQSQVPCRIEVARLRQFLDRIGRQTPCDRAMIDLRDDQAWRELDEAVARRRHWPMLIGIVQGGYPLHYAPLGDLVLADAIAIGSLPVDWRRRLTEAQGRHERICRRFLGQRHLVGARHGLISYTPELFPLIDEMAIVAKHNYNLLITGETGTGKTTLARLVHDLSPRASKRFLTVSCGALPTDLMGSELFGHVRGAFTGADRDKEGKFSYADGGTLVLEEIDTLDLAQQAKLLRVLEWGEFEQVGSNETRRVDVRTIVTANVHLERLVEEGRFRADLYYRLRQMTFDLPPLRKRPRDMAWLVRTLVEECRATHQLTVDRIDPRLLDVLRRLPWPGNIRDLRNEIFRAVLFSSGGVLTPESLSRNLLTEAESPRRDLSSLAPGAPASELAEGVATAEVETIRRALRTARFNRSAAARLLGISRVTLYNKMRKYDIRIEDQR